MHEKWIKLTERLPTVRERAIWMWDGKSVHSMDSTSRMTADAFAEFYPTVTHWMPKEPPKPPEPPND
jgi:hypothetical protein